MLIILQISMKVHILSELFLRRIRYAAEAPPVRLLNMGAAAKAAAHDAVSTDPVYNAGRAPHQRD